MKLFTDTLISYEKYCKHKQCDVRYAFYVKAEDADKRIEKLKGLDGITNIMRQDNHCWHVG